MPATGWHRSLEPLCVGTGRCDRRIDDSSVSPETGLTLSQQSGGLPRVFGRVPSASLRPPLHQFEPGSSSIVRVGAAERSIIMNIVGYASGAFGFLLAWRPPAPTPFVSKNRSAPRASVGGRCPGASRSAFGSDMTTSTAIHDTTGFLAYSRDNHGIQARLQAHVGRGGSVSRAGQSVWFSDRDQTKHRNLHARTTWTAPERLSSVACLGNG